MVTEAHRKSRICLNFSSTNLDNPPLWDPHGDSRGKFSFGGFLSVKQRTDLLLSVGMSENIIMNKCFLHQDWFSLVYSIYIKDHIQKYINLKKREMMLCTRFSSFPSDYASSQDGHLGKLAFVCHTCTRQLVESRGTMTHLTIWVFPPLNRPLQLTGNTAWALSNHRSPLF